MEFDRVIHSSVAEVAESGSPRPQHYLARERETPAFIEVPNLHLEDTICIMIKFDLITLFASIQSAPNLYHGTCRSALEVWRQLCDVK